MQLAANNFFYEKKLLNSVEILEQFLFFFYMHANHVISHYLMTIAHKALFWRKTFSSSSWSRKNIYWSRTKSTRFFAKKMTRQTFWHKALVIDLLVCQKWFVLEIEPQKSIHIWPLGWFVGPPKKCITKKVLVSLN